MVKIKRFMQKNKDKLDYTLLFLASVLTPIQARAEISAEWQGVYDKLSPWVNKVAWLLFFLGLIDFGIAHVDESVDKKVKGAAKMLAGIFLYLVYQVASGVYNL